MKVNIEALKERMSPDERALIDFAVAVRETFELMTQRILKLDQRVKVLEQASADRRSREDLEANREREQSDLR